MSDIIHLLPDSVANQIAAGEVIQRPSSALKELIENSIDAEADTISVQIKHAGRTLIQVVDNGKGMSETDARMAFERHATSKISEINDLYSLHSLGFRGEALASIAAVAQVELKTRRAEDELGTLIRIAGSRVLEQEPVQCDIGTTVAVKNLFFNVPARRRFLKSDNVEKNHLLYEFYNIALVHPQVSFLFYDEEELIYNLSPSNIKLRIENIFGKNLRKRWEQQLLPIESTTNLVKIYGYVGKPEYAQKSANQYFFVNGRYMRHPYFHKAVLTAYEQMIHENESPNYFIYFEIDPKNIDVNIHPSKTEIKFENEQAIWSILLATIKEALGKFNIIPSIDFNSESDVKLPPKSSMGNVVPPQPSFNPYFNPFGDTTYQRTPLNWEELYKGFEKNKGMTIEKQSPDETLFGSMEYSSDEKGKFFDNNLLATSYFQLKNHYVLTGIKSGLLIIDQHKAHLRILFETFLNQMELQKGFSQQLLFPETLKLTVNDALFFETIIEPLKKTGFIIEDKGNNMYEIKGIPASLESVNIIELLHDLIEKSKITDEDPSLHIKETIALTLSKAASLKVGQALTAEEMSGLIDQLFACKDPYYTPDGKKIMIVISEEEIEKRFQK